MRRKLAMLAVLVGIISIAMGGFFIFQGFAKAEMLTKAMTSENITYNSADGTINGVIDTPQEAQAMAAVLKEHRDAMGNYSQLKRDDPNRQQILNAMTMENSLNLAQMGFGLTQVVEGSGAFMILMGLTFGAGGIVVLRSKKAQPTT